MTDRLTGNDTTTPSIAATERNMTVTTTIDRTRISTTLFHDDFRHGFDAASGQGNWFYSRTGEVTGNDGNETTSSAGLQVSTPRFTRTVGPDETVPGGLDHVKWLVHPNHVTNHIPGFSAEAGRVVSVEATLSAQTVGTQQHPFGAAVTDADDDPRLACAALNAMDFETWLVFDFLLTNRGIYALYERLPFGRGEGQGDYAAFSCQVPLVARRPSDRHRLGIHYDRSAGVARWQIDGTEHFRVERLGYRLDRHYVTLDLGGQEAILEPRQLTCGLALFTLLDGSLPSGRALVRLDPTPDAYFDPAIGAPARQTFVDETSRQGSRLFGQGAEMQVADLTVQSHPAAA